MQQTSRPDLCFGLPPMQFMKCLEIIQISLQMSTAVNYWDTKGCLGVGSQGAALHQPCPAHAICGWLTDPLGFTYCPTDMKFLPRASVSQDLLGGMGGMTASGAAGMSSMMGSAAGVGMMAGMTGGR
eukprot:g3877.t1